LLLSFFLFLLIYKKDKFTLVLIICVIISVLPVLSLGIDTHDSESERFIYIASVFVVILLIEITSWLKIKSFVIFFSILLTVHIVLFIEAADSYKYASLISRKTLECMGNLSKEKIIVLDVPSQYKGALIFRKGFEAAVVWILNGNKDSVEIVSIKEVFQKAKSFNCVTLNSLSIKEFQVYNIFIHSNAEMIILNNKSMMFKKVFFKF
jgi:hypothetical protein